MHWPMSTNGDDADYGDNSNGDDDNDNKGNEEWVDTMMI